MHPILFQIGPVTIYSYGACVAAAFLVGILMAASRAKRYGWEAETIYDMSFYILLAAIAGSRLLYILGNPEEFISHPWEIFMVWKGGLVFYGGVFAAMLAGAVYLRRRGLSVAEGFDMFIPSLALGHAIGRFGCFLNGCCFGKISSLPWAVSFPEGSPVYIYQLYEAGCLQPGSLRSIPVQPVQLYAVFMELTIFVTLFAYFPRKKFHGQIFWLYLLLYGAGRFTLEFLRADNRVIIQMGPLGLSVPQLMSAAAVTVAAVVLLSAGARKRERMVRCNLASPEKRKDT